MGISINKESYEEMIAKDIEAIVDCMPKHSLEKKHIIEVLTWSVDKLYPTDNTSPVDEYVVLCKPNFLNKNGEIVESDKAEINGNIIYLAHKSELYVR